MNASETPTLIDEEEMDLDPCRVDNEYSFPSDMLALVLDFIDSEDGSRTFVTTSTKFSDIKSSIDQ